MLLKRRVKEFTFGVGWLGFSVFVDDTLNDLFVANILGLFEWLLG